MASTYSTSLKLELIGDGDQSGIWGQTTNNNLGTLLEQAIAGVVSITMTDANYTLTSFNGVSDEARNAVLVVGGTNGAVRDIIAPLVKKTYIIRNATIGGYGVRIIGSSGTGVTIPNGVTTTVYCDGTNFNAALNGSVSDFTVNGILYGNAAGASAINASNVSSGTINNARTTAASANGASTIVLRDTNGSFAGNVVSASNFAGGTFTTTNFTISESAGVLQIMHGATLILTINSAGNVTAKGNITAFGSI